MTDAPAHRAPQSDRGNTPDTPARITLLTDFGTRDGYVAAMKGVIAVRAPHVIIDDASHDIPPGDLHSAAWALAAYWLRYPVGSVHVVVVDPGVGSARRALALRAVGRFLVGPDNGVFTRALLHSGVTEIVSIENTTLIGDVASATFHGRDIFAPAAAHLAVGGALHSLGPAADQIVRLPLPQPRLHEGRVVGEVVHVDRFGNLISNIPSSLAAAGSRVSIAGRSVPLVRTYADVEPGSLCALIGSSDVVEISVRDGSAADVLECGRGAAVRWNPADLISA